MEEEKKTEEYTHEQAKEIQEKYAEEEMRSLDREYNREMSEALNNRIPAHKIKMIRPDDIEPYTDRLLQLMKEDEFEAREKFSEKFLPKVLRSDLKIYNFELDYIKNRLLKETDITVENAEKVNRDVVRLIIDISKNIKIITGPMLRELCNSILLQHGLEIERLQNTRVGFPLYELKKLKEQGKINKNVSTHVWKEYENVHSIIKRLKENGKERSKILPKIQKDLI